MSKRVFCSSDNPTGDPIPASLIRAGMLKLVREDYPDFSDDSLICREGLERYRARYVTRLREVDKGELGDLEREVVASIQDLQLELLQDVTNRAATKNEPPE